MRIRAHKGKFLPLKQTSQRLQKLAWAWSPTEVFSRLEEEDSLVFLDTAGHLPHRANEAFSILAANAKEVLTGHITQSQELDEAVQQSTFSATDCGFPLGAWIGTVDYEGTFHFGLYENLLIYSHRTGEWWETGETTLSQKIGELVPVKFPQVTNWKAHLTQSEFEAKVLTAQELIAAGDIYQVNLSNRFQADLQQGSLRGLYESLRNSSPAPMSAYLKLGDREILSSSPELFLKLSGNSVQTRPIKGTRPRFQDPEQDIRSSHELSTSEKEMAELVMITDLLRNDLGKICDFGSIQVDVLAQLETLAQVHHLVSTVSGTLREDISHVQALQESWPGGSITGAPKKRACEIIDQLETIPRGLYTGALGYFGLNGESQFNIAIRTLVREEQQLHYHVGAGVVADSNPTLEYEETLHKGRGIRLALGLEE